MHLHPQNRTSPFIILSHLPHLLSESNLVDFPSRPPFLLYYARPRDARGYHVRETKHEDQGYGVVALLYPARHVTSVAGAVGRGAGGAELKHGGLSVRMEVVARAAICTLKEMNLRSACDGGGRDVERKLWIARAHADGEKPKAGNLSHRCVAHALRGEPRSLSPSHPPSPPQTRLYSLSLFPTSHTLQASQNTRPSSMTPPRVQAFSCIQATNGPSMRLTAEFEAETAELEVKREFTTLASTKSACRNTGEGVGIVPKWETRLQMEQVWGLQVQVQR
ncbi:hypothetical protein PSPO01_09494 [Paraphaeosphaeria sporulosa]